MSILERSIVCSAYNDKHQVTLFRSYRNFQAWYTLEVFTMGKNDPGDSYTYSRDYYDTDKAFDRFNDWIAKHDLTIEETKGA